MTIFKTQKNKHLRCVCGLSILGILLYNKKLNRYYILFYYNFIYNKDNWIYAIYNVIVTLITELFYNLLIVREKPVNQTGKGLYLSG